MTGPSDKRQVVEPPEVRGSPKSPRIVPEKSNNTLEPPLRGDTLATSPPSSADAERSTSTESTETAVELQTPQEIEADDDITLVGRGEDDDANIAIDNDISSTISLASSATSFKYENGRRYHAQNDAQNDRLDLFHHLLTLRCDDKLHMAPIEEPQRILDLGTGTGIWAIQMGDAYASATVLGNDLSPVQPNVVPPNVIFEVDDIEAEWCFSKRFDYIHCRYLAGAISDWPRLMEQAFKFTKPGGWVEFQDFDMKFYSVDGTYIIGSPTEEWTREVVSGLRAMGREPDPGLKLERWIQNAGFTNVHYQCLPIPMGIWPKDRRLKEIGACDLSTFLEGLEAMSLRALMTGLNWSRDEVLAYLPAVRRDMKNRRVHAMHDFHIVWAQKPLPTRTHA